MDPRLFLAVVLLFLALPFSTQEHSREAPPTCPSNFTCGNLSLKFPFTDLQRYNCGLSVVDCSVGSPLRISLVYPPEQWFVAKSINHSFMTLQSQFLPSLLHNQSCYTFFSEVKLPNSASISFTLSNIITLYRCQNNSGRNRREINESFSEFSYFGGCPGNFIYYDKHPNSGLRPNGSVGPLCSVVHLPYNKSFSQEYKSDHVPEVFRLLGDEFDLKWHVSEDCYECHSRGGVCQTEWSKEPRCANAKKGHGRGKRPVGIILGSALAAAVILLILAVSLIWCRKKGIRGPFFLSRNLSKQSSKLDLEDGNVYLGVFVFTYSELREATKNFDPSKELGDGGFGTVYHGKLRDGREVAVKRLYEHNFKRMEQFKNEIEILTRLRHPSLVTLYGCTSRRSRELLLVYEYVPNGTVADHLHGDKAEHKILTWDHRMNIAIETADALAYLHATDIIHRDVKTNNILLDHNFCVKVADFGLSRLFPTDVTHVSTAPQGTPGYVDPEYYQCYHLTDKSDVYSFGVVLIELISSMPAVDISRHRHEINLASWAINRIQRCAFDELIDPFLGHKSHAEVLRMTTSVAELAFQCLQGEKEMRPTMEQVLENLKEIHNFRESLKDNTSDSIEKVDKTRSNPIIAFSPDSDDRVLLRNFKFPSSPNSVTHKWVSGSSTSADTTG